MWVDRKLYDDLRKGLWEATAANLILEKQVTAQQGTIDWMALRLTQMEHERAQLLYNYTGVKIETPVVRRGNPKDERVDLDTTPSFTDVGDKLAEKLGISWNPDGTVNYSQS